MAHSPLRIAGLCGSLRKASYNRFALEAAGAHMPSGMELSVLDIRGFPMFDADVLAEGLPDDVKRAREAVRAADALLIASPEYNFSVSGVLKNAIDWMSRGDDQPFAGKPVAILSATQGPLGGARSQYDLRKILVFLDAMVLNKPEIFIGMAPGKFDAGGALTDAPTRDILARQMAALEKLVHFGRRGRVPS